MSASDRPPAMADVASLAGVSTMTVSRVINDHSRVSASTRERVLAAIEQLGYRSSMAARTLAGGKSRVIGAISSDTIFFGASRMLWGVQAAAREAGYFVNFATLRAPTSASMSECIDHLLQGHVEGIVVLAPLRSSVDAIVETRLDVPMVIASGATDVATSVGIDQHLGARLATRHLLELGHDTVHHVRGPKGWIGAEARAEGWRSELKAQRRKVPAVLDGDWTPAAGYVAGTALAADPSVSAVFVANDQMALGLLLAMKQHGRRVPDDVSIVGFDDTPESAYFDPPLTTIHQDFSEVGRRCVEQLLATIDGREYPQHVVLEPSLLLRSSTAAPTA